MLARMRPRASLGLVLFVLACTPTPASSQTPAAGSIESRLCGTWTASGSVEGSVVQERWWIGEGGLIGEGLTFDPQGELVGREAMSIVPRTDGSTYVAQPEGAEAPTEFEQTESDAASTWTWTNPTHDFPQTIRYALEGDDQLIASISGPDGEGGTQTARWTFVRVAPCS